MKLSSIFSYSICFFVIGVIHLLHTTSSAQNGKPTDIVVADFEADSYGSWIVEGEAFGKGPAAGTLPGQMAVSGFEGKKLVNSYHGRDGATGQLTSPEFAIERPWLNFLIGGGGYAGETCMNLVIEGEIVRSATGPNTKPGGSERLESASWDIREFVGKQASIQIVDQRTGGWGHINVDQIVQSDTRAAPTQVPLSKRLAVNDSHLIIPVANSNDKENLLRLGIYRDDLLIQNLNVSLPRDGAAYWLAAYPLSAFDISGKEITIAPVEGGFAPESCRAAFEQIRVGPASDAYTKDDFNEAYRNQFHPSTRRGWNNDPNGMVFHDGKYHLYYQHNPVGIFWGNMHWGHFESVDLIHWQEQPIALFQKTVNDMAFSGGGFVDFNNSAGLGLDKLFVAFTSTGRGECLAYSENGGQTFVELKENPVVRHAGRDPKIIWYEPEKKWVMVVYDNQECVETKTIVPTTETEKRRNANIAFWESTNLRRWERTGAFTDADRNAVFECPEFFELPIQGNSQATRWILYAAQNRYFVGRFDGQRFIKESGPHGSSHGAFYAAQTFSDTPDGRRIQIGWVRTNDYVDRFPDQIVNQAFTLPHELTLHDTADGLRLFFTPVDETRHLRAELLGEGENLTGPEANRILQTCRNELTEVVMEFAESGRKDLLINGIDASFDGRSARIFTDRTFNEIYADDGASYELRKRTSADFTSSETGLKSGASQQVVSVKVYRLRSIWPANES